MRHMEQVLIDNWNQTIRRDDEVIFGGDFALTGFDHAARLCATLHGYKVIILGNHDGTRRRMTRIGFREAYHRLEIDNPHGQGKILIVHNPRNLGSGDGYQYALYGHTHNSWLHAQENFLSMAVEINKYTPQTLEGLIKNNHAYRRRHGVRIMSIY
jgi:calcineurin-like phosphoesterase family protein